ncbi:hypothetical protein [Leeia sp.]|uniref:hypothetical protein n=1 Tax=Leeia sp. TaxID=2884678 RepID=UPI0035B0CB7D
MAMDDESGGDVWVQDRSRRTLLKASLSMSVLPIAAASPGALAAPISWVHGNSAAVINAHQLEADSIRGNARVVQGRSWSTLSLHYAIPSPMQLPGPLMKVSAIWIRMQGGKGASISSVALHDGEIALVRLDTLNLQHEQWQDVRIPLATPLCITRCIGVTFECQFADVDRYISISAVGCELA